MTEPALVNEFTNAAQELHDAVLRVQEVAEKITDHASRMRSMSNALNDFGSTLDTPGKVMRLPRGIVPERKAEDAA